MSVPDGYPSKAELLKFAQQNKTKQKQNEI